MNTHKYKQYNARDSEGQKQNKNGKSNINRTKQNRTWPLTGSCKFQKT